MSINYDPEESGGWPLAKERAAVAKGAALLDRILPGWYKKVKLNKLEMASGAQCMLGQLFGHGVEGRLAETMYPEEMAKAKSYAGSYGYARATCVPYKGLTRQGSLLERLMAKLNLRGKKKHDAELAALRHACTGHDNKCLWAEAVAERRAADSEQKNVKRS